MPGQIGALEADVCGLYVCLTGFDPSPGGIASIVTDYIDAQGEPHFSGWPGTLGPLVWIDHDPRYPDPGEWIFWGDENYQDHPPGDPNFPPGLLATDYQWNAEELALVSQCIDPFIEDSTQDLRFRATDWNGNWRRTDNVLEIALTGLHEVEDLIFRGPRYDGEGERRVGCDGYVAERPGGGKCLDLNALVVTAVDEVEPPEFIEALLDAPLDQRGGPGLGGITVPLYRLNPEDPAWEEILADFDFDGEGCVLHIYRRGENLLYKGNIIEAAPVFAVDYHVSQQPEGPDDYGPNGTQPYLYVSSNDALISSPGDDYKDYSVAIGSTSPGDYHIWHAREPMEVVHYGDGNRGTFEPAAGGCKVDDEYQDNYRSHVLGFGFEWVKAMCNDETASYPVQSQGDIMFVHAHGLICGFNDQGECEGHRQCNSYMRCFHSGWREPPQCYDCLFPGDMLFANDWEAIAAHDATWLAATSCWLLADYTTTGDQCQPWHHWMELVWCSPLRSVMGFRAEHVYHNASNWQGSGPPPTPETYFWQRFCGLLEMKDYPGDPDRWYGGVPAQEYGCRCYMEAAWEYYHGLLGDVAAYQTYPEWGDVDENHKHLLWAAAVSTGYRYVLHSNDPPHGNGEVLIFTR